MAQFRPQFNQIPQLGAIPQIGAQQPLPAGPITQTLPAANDPLTAQPGISLALPAGQVPAGPVQPLTGQVQAQPVGAAVPLDPTQAPVQQPGFGLTASEQAIGQGLGASVAALEEGATIARGDISTGFQGALDQIGATRGDVAAQIAQGQRFFDQAGNDITDQINQGVSGLDPFLSTGQQAQQRQAALSGALGPEAQAQAFAEFQASPEQAFLQEEGQRNLLRNQAAIGGLGGGNVRRELLRQGIGFAAQDLGNRFNRLGTVAERGFGAAQNIGQLRAAQAGLTGQIGAGQAGLSTQEAALASSLGLNASQFEAAKGVNLASVAGSTATNLATTFTGAGRDLATGRTRAGELIAENLAGTTSALGELIAEQGKGISDTIGTGAANVANLQSITGQLTANQLQTVATILANVSLDEGAKLAFLEQAVGKAQAEGIINASAGLRAGIQQVAAAAVGAAGGGGLTGAIEGGFGV